MAPPSARSLRVLAVDGSALRRQAWAAIATDISGLLLIGTAVSVEEGLQLVAEQQPDVILLDLEMGGTDGFVLLQRVMAERPTPILVIVSKNTMSRDRAVRALEMGAVDLLSAPVGGRGVEPKVRDELIQKLAYVNRLRVTRLAERAERSRMQRISVSQPNLIISVEAPDRKSEQRGAPPSKVIAIGASTGGPSAVTQLLANLDARLGFGLLITQHMPARFTKAFAERLDRSTAWTVREAETGDLLEAGTALVSPGGGSMRIRRSAQTWKIEVEAPTGEERFVPSIDRMLETAAQSVGKDLIAVILTGMAGDASVGVREVKAAGGLVVVESPESAALSGMPDEALRATSADHVGSLVTIVEFLQKHGRR